MKIHYKISKQFRQLSRGGGVPESFSRKIPLGGGPERGEGGGGNFHHGGGGGESVNQKWIQNSFVVENMEFLKYMYCLPLPNERKCQCGHILCRESYQPLKYILKTVSIAFPSSCCKTLA